jgi:hypothetical protein
VVNDEPADLGVLAKQTTDAVAVSDTDRRDRQQTRKLAAECNADAFVVDSSTLRATAWPISEFLSSR